MRSNSRLGKNRDACVNTERKRWHRLEKFRRMLKAKIGQVQDRGLLAVAGETAAKLKNIPGHRAAPCRKTPDDFDAKYGTDTSGIVQPWNLDIPDNTVGQAIQYGTVGAADFTKLLASLDIEHEQYSFIDLGSGKGRALLLASRFPFKQIIGVELSPQLQQTSWLNIRRFRADWQQCINIVSRCQNATGFTFPTENAVLYLFNPFGAETLRAVVANLESSLRAAPRRIYVIYVKPVHKRVFEESERFVLLRATQGNVIYVNDMPELGTDRAARTATRFDVVD